jgi:uncharacterized membrane protein
MGEFLVATFASRSAAHQASIALDKRRSHGATIYGSALVCKDSDNRISVSHRKEHEGAPAMVAAVIGALAGFAAGPVGVVTGAISGALVGLAADAIARESHTNLLKAISREVARDGTVLMAEVAPADLGCFETLIRHCGGTILHSTAETVSRLADRRDPTGRTESAGDLAH